MAGSARWDGQGTEKGDDVPGLVWLVRDLASPTCWAETPLSQPLSPGQGNIWELCFQKVDSPARPHPPHHRPALHMGKCRFGADHLSPQPHMHQGLGEAAPLPFPGVWSRPGQASPAHLDSCSGV